MAGPRAHSVPVLESLLALLNSGGGSAIAIRSSPGRAAVTRDRLTGDVMRFAGTVTAAARTTPDAASVWVGTRDPYLTLVATLGCLYGRSVALMEANGPPRGYDTLAEGRAPALVVCDDANADIARWARARGHHACLIDPNAVGERHRPATGAGPRDDVVLQFFTSGTTGPAKCVGIGAEQLVSAILGVGGRLALTPADTSLSVAPLTHTLGMVTTVLVALASGGGVAFADPMRPRELLDTLAQERPTWCAASPSGHNLVYKLLRRTGTERPRLRFLRASAAPMADDLARQLEDYHAAPVVNAYVMTEAPGEIASQALDGDRRSGTVGSPTLCDVEIRSGGRTVPAGTAGDIWIRGPNVVPADPATGRAWLPTGDIGVFDDAGFLRISGRADDIINSGGLKIWPPDIEAAACADPSVDTAVAFPIPHSGMGETIGLTVVAAPGRTIDPKALRRRLMAELPRHAWPSTIVVCAEIPRSARGKISRRGMWRQLPGVNARLDA